ncbi:MAG TPA: hypothetical protein VL053_17295 [Arachidicoccus sp.]|nr:hypothetical protein [Arachidicoccus sp.]
MSILFGPDERPGFSPDATSIKYPDLLCIQNPSKDIITGRIRGNKIRYLLMEMIICITSDTPVITFT